MNELVANTTEAAVEKHIPVVNIDGNKVKVQVGSTLHPMIPEYYIAWIYVVTKKVYNVKTYIETMSQLLNLL